jgi:hypothetical protein
MEKRIEGLCFAASKPTKSSTIKTRCVVHMNNNKYLGVRIVRRIVYDKDNS